MKIELFISKDRIPYIVDFLGADRVTVSEYNEDQDMIKFELDSQLDLLHIFHAGIRYGSDSMAKVLRRVV
jgi:hypothetical protein